MSRTTDIESYENAFGTFRFEEGDRGRSMLSPAAYLADLLQLVEDNFESDASAPEALDLLDRRPDIGEIPLDGRHTFTTLPVIDIVNRLLEREVHRAAAGGAGPAVASDSARAETAYRKLREARSPLTLPFDLAHARRRLILSLHGQDPVALRRLFATGDPDALAEAADLLGLSDLQRTVLADEPDSAAEAEAAVAQAMPGVVTDPTGINADELQAALGVSAVQLRALVTAQLSESAKRGDDTERALAPLLFANHGLSGTMMLDGSEDPPMLKWTGTNDADAWIWLDRTARLVRLAKWTGRDIIDLERFLRTCCEGRLHGEALRRLAIVGALAQDHEVSLWEASLLLSDLDPVGIGEDRDAPLDPFNQRLNAHAMRDRSAFVGEPPSLPGQQPPVGPFTPLPYAEAGVDDLEAPSDLLADDARAFRRRLAGALDLGPHELAGLVRICRRAARRHDRDSSALDRGAALGPATWSLLARLALLMRMIDGTPDDLAALVEVVEADLSLARRNVLELVATRLPGTTRPRLARDFDGFAVLEDGDPATRLWLGRTVVGIGAWLVEAGIDAATLRSVVAAPAAPAWDEDDLEDVEAVLAEEERQEAEQDARVAALTSLLEAARPTLLSDAVLVGAGVEPRLAGITAQVVQQPHRGLTVPGRPEILQAAAPLLRAAAFDAVRDAERLHPDDLVGLGLGRSLAERSHAQLQRVGLLGPDGALTLPDESAPDADVVLARDLSALHPGLFQLIQRIVADGAARSGAGEDVAELELFRSDLGDIGAAPDEVDELYDTLVYNGLVDEDGQVLRPELLVKAQSAADLPLESGLAALEAPITRLREERLAVFFATPIAFRASHLAELDLDASEVDSLLDNLRFNRYLDEDGHLTDRRRVLELTGDDLDVALPFYPHRHRIAAALGAAVEAQRVALLSLAPDDLVPLAEDAAAAQVWDALHTRWLADGNVPPAWHETFSDPDQARSFDLGPGPLHTASAAAFSAVHQSLLRGAETRLTEADLQTLGLDPQEARVLHAGLQADGHLDEVGGLNLRDLPTWTDPYAAARFEIDGAADYARDVFFLLHALAGALTQRVDGLVAALSSVQDAQEAATIGSLAEHLGLEVDSARVVLNQTLGRGRPLASVCLPPLLAVTNAAGVLVSEPTDGPFNAGMRRARQVSALAAALGLDAGGLRVAFRDQSLTDGFPERLALVEDDPQIDAVLVEADGTTLVFSGGQYRVYDPVTGRGEDQAHPLAELALELGPDDNGVARSIDAAFHGPDGETWLLSGAVHLRRAPGDDRFAPVGEREWGLIASRFDDPERIDAAFTDEQGHVMLLVGDQYVRYEESSFPAATEALDLAAAGQPARVELGYPRPMREFWEREAGIDDPLAEARADIDAAVAGERGAVLFFAGASWWSSDDPLTERSTPDRWGRLEGAFDDAVPDTLLDLGGRLFATRGEWAVEIEDQPEHGRLLSVEGSLQRLASILPSAPERFHDSIHAGFTGWDGKVHLFRREQFATLPEEGKATGQPIVGSWGRVRNPLFDDGTVDAVLSGLDGRVYVFSDDLVYRYSGRTYRTVDDGWPRKLSDVFGGLETVHSAFVLDGKTYLFGTPTPSNDPEAPTNAYLRYSTSDYTTPDEGFPEAVVDHWWNLPAALADTSFTTPDAAFTDLDGITWLFSGTDFITFDAARRWWSEPQPILERWPGLQEPDNAADTALQVDAAFVGKDLRVYLFRNSPPAGEPVYARFTDRAAGQVDDRYPRAVKGEWGYIEDEIARTGRIDAALALVAREREDDPDAGPTWRTHARTYLFSGDHVYRYTHNLPEDTDAAFQAAVAALDYTTTFVDAGFPRRINPALAAEARFADIEGRAPSAIRGAYADRVQVYLQNGDQVIVLSDRPGAEPDDTQPEPWALPGGTRAYMQDGAAVYGLGTSGVWSHLGVPESDTRATPPASLIARWSTLRDAAPGLPAKTDGRGREPRALRGAPAAWRRDLDAALQGTDGNVYLFKDTEVWDVDLGEKHRIADGWGRPRNPIQDLDRVDAAFTGRDGDVYLFGGDRFVRYRVDPRRPTTIPERADGLPRSISASWGGLRNVRYAWVRGDQTVLVEQPDATGRFRYQTWRGDSYDRPEHPEPQVAGPEFWGIPAAIQADGFETFDAVVIDEDDTIYVRGRRFVMHDGQTNHWHGPRPIERLWRGLPEEHPTNDDIETFSVHTALVGPRGRLVVFSQRQWTERTSRRSGTWTLLQDISARWGLLDVSFATLDRVDAAFVHRGTTWLFSGGEYARYSEADYRHADDGYPRQIAENLRREAPFSAFDADLEVQLAELGTADKRVRGVWADDGTLSLVLGDGDARVLHATALGDNRAFPAARVGRVRNTLQETGQVDAAVRLPDGATLLLSGDQLLRYSDLDQPFVDEGYPKPLWPALGQVVAHTVTPAEASDVDGLDLRDGLDAAFLIGGDRLYLCKDRRFVRVTPNRTLHAHPLREHLGRLTNPFEQRLGDPNPALDAAFVGPDGAFYALAGGLVARSARPDSETLEPGFPRPLGALWPTLPTGVAADKVAGPGVVAAFVFDGRTYLLGDSDHVRYTDGRWRVPDDGYPMALWKRWTGGPDLQLSDVVTIQRFVALDARRQTDHSLFDLLDDQAGVKAEPYALVAKEIRAELEDVQWLKVHDAFLDRDGLEAEEPRLDMELVLELARKAEVAGRLATPPDELHRAVWLPLYGGGDQNDGIDELERLLDVRNPGSDGETIHKQLHDALSRQRRDALVAWLLHHGPADAQPLKTDRDISAHLLIDVRTEPVVESSLIREAISAVQTYLHRFFVNLEQLDTGVTGAADESRRETLRTWWRWMRNYRVWEANRKIFLYPENYLRPELRTDKTPAFQTLEQELIKGEVTDAEVTRVYKAYLDAFVSVSSLVAAGGYRSIDPAGTGEQNLLLVGRTESSPESFFYREATFEGEVSDVGTWGPWHPIDVTIVAKRVYPVRAFGRIIVFWLEERFETLPDAEGELVLDDSSDTAKTTNKDRTVRRLDLKYATPNLDGSWAGAQTVTIRHTEATSGDDPDSYKSGRAVALDQPADEVRLSVQTVERDGVSAIDVFWGAKVRSQSTGLMFRRKSGYIYDGVTITADFVARRLETRRDPAPDNFELLKKILVSSATVTDMVPIDDEAWQGSSGWFAFRDQGGSFLIRPLESSLSDANRPRKLVDLQPADNPDHLPAWSAGLGAAVQAHSGERWFFRPTPGARAPGSRTSQTWLAVDTSGSSTEASAAQTWGRVPTALSETKAVTVAVATGRTANGGPTDLYLLSNDNGTLRGLHFQPGEALADRDGERTISEFGAALAPLPAWSDLTAATQHGDTSWTFFNSSGQSADTRLATPSPIEDRWGHAWNGLSEPTDPDPVQGAFLDGARLYLVGTLSTRTWASADARTSTHVAAQTAGLRAVVTALGVTNPADAPESPIRAAYNQGKDTVVFHAVPSSGGPVIPYIVNLTGTRQVKRNNSGVATARSMLHHGTATRALPITDGPSQHHLGFGTAAVGLQDGTALLFRGRRVVTLTAAERSMMVKEPHRSIFGQVDWADPVKDVLKREGASLEAPWLQHCVLTPNSPVTAAFVRAGPSTGEVQTFLFQGSRYVRYTHARGARPGGLVDGDVDNALRTFGGVGDDLPSPGRIRSVGAAATLADTTWLFSGADCWSLDATGTLTAHKTVARFGDIANDILERGVQTAFREGDYVYVIGEDDILRYTRPTGKPGQRADRDYLGPHKLPKRVHRDGSSDSVAVLHVRSDPADVTSARDRQFLFDGRKQRLFDPANPDARGAAFRDITQDWRNLPPPFEAGFDAALYATADSSALPARLHLVRGGQVASFTLDDDDQAEPFELGSTRYEMTRLSTTSGVRMSEILLQTDLDRLLSLETQQTDESPRVEVDRGSSNSVVVNSKMVPEPPSSDELGFESANGLYYWEVFFHAPLLIAQLLNTRERFEDAKTWYDRIFDPTRPATVELNGTSSTSYWRFWPFAADLSPTPRIQEQARDRDTIRVTLDQPGDPHAIAATRPIAYEKATVMAAIDNLLDWGDHLFTQYTGESVDEARALYLLAWDLLGGRPEPSGARAMTPARSWLTVADETDAAVEAGYDLLLFLETTLTSAREGGPSLDLADPYFYLPHNSEFVGYWDRVADRLHKIRNAMNIEGVYTPLALFEPPIDPMALVRAAAGGGGLGGATALLSSRGVPHYRYSFLLAKAQAMVQRVTQLGEQLLGTLEKKDAEALARLQAQHESAILGLTKTVHGTRIEEAAKRTQAARQSQANALARQQRYQLLLDEGLHPEEEAQIVLMSIAGGLHTVAAFASLVSAGPQALPEVTVGAFSFGFTAGGNKIAEIISKIGQFSQNIGEGLSIFGEALAAIGQHHRMFEEWGTQIMMAEHEAVQLGLEVEASTLAHRAAQEDLKVVEEQIKHNAALSAFYTSKFTSQELYGWMEGELAHLYRRSYELALDLARAAQAAYAYERGLPNSAVDFIRGDHWDRGHRGLLAGDRLALDLERMDQAYVESHARSMEITRTISMTAAAPLALIRLREHGSCVFDLTEEMFDRDFPGHYRRQIKTVAVVVESPTGAAANATLTQLSNRVVLEPDPKAVKYLLTGKGEPPTTIRTNWRHNQQIAFSEPDEYGFTTGLFELRFDSEQYLPFEGTGAVSSWRLQVSGPGARDLIRSATDVSIKIRYTARSGGDAFGSEVQRMLRPAPRFRLFDVPAEFPDAWSAAASTGVLTLPLTRDRFPGMSGGRIDNLLATADTQDGSPVDITIAGDGGLKLPDGSLIDATGLRIGPRGTALRLELDGELEQVTSLLLVMGYRGGDW